MWKIVTQLFDLFLMKIKKPVEKSVTGPFFYLFQLFLGKTIRKLCRFDWKLVEVGEKKQIYKVHSYSRRMQCVK